MLFNRQSTLKCQSLKAPLFCDGVPLLLARSQATSTGSPAGDAVLQMYIHHMGTKVEEPREALKGFERVNLAPDETPTVTLPLKASALAWWDEKLCRWRGSRARTSENRRLFGGHPSKHHGARRVNLP